MRIKYIIPYPLDENGVRNRAAQIRLDVLGPNTVVECVPVRNAPPGDTHFETLLNDAYIVEAGMSAEKEGYDGVVMDTVSDSGLYPLRSRLSIPVIGPGLTSYLYALLLGTRFTIVTMWKEWAPLHERNLTSYGLWDKCASIRALEVAPDVSNLLGDKAPAVAESIAVQAHEAIAREGADVVVLGSTTMHETEPYLGDLLDVPVVNPGPLAIKTMETLITHGLTHSKARFPAPTEDCDDMLRALPSNGAARPEQEQ